VPTPVPASGTTIVPVAPSTVELPVAPPLPQPASVKKTIAPAKAHLSSRHGLSLEHIVGNP
ncbi:MAG TPA: hypothetical protein VGP64_03205, partial [Polyangia bacterium]